ncbi:unnamed protein product [Prunus armeniaca]|uniref:Viral late gene transcription factor 3 zinc ribbon domain-containing protein n=1 Tax=Prunus armeniaca TaxID=36596 RepID=A0A6J5URL8_PRUAR|nr:unnamed protein product [Prunus armeniaca]
MEASVSSFTQMATTSTSNNTLLGRSLNISKHESFTRKPMQPEPAASYEKTKHKSLEGCSNHDVPVVADPTPVAITWQIVVGAVAGVTPFVVAGIEFSKRIIAQKRCEVCGGSGLVLTKQDYVKCPGCGGFLPWQSWKRFFSG